MESSESDPENKSVAAIAMMLPAKLRLTLQIASNHAIRNFWRNVEGTFVRVKIFYHNIGKGCSVSKASQTTCRNTESSQQERGKNLEAGSR